MLQQRFRVLHIDCQKQDFSRRVRLQIDVVLVETVQIGFQMLEVGFFHWLLRSDFKMPEI